MAMVEVVGSWLKFMSWMFLSIVNPLSLIKLVFIIALRTVTFAVLVWLHLLRAVAIFHVDLCWRVLLCAATALSFPIRLFTALLQKRVLEMRIHNIQVQLDSLVWENKELEEQLEMAIQERKVVEMLLEEVEEDHEKALSRIDVLEAELQDLKVVNLRLNEVQGKTVWSYKYHEEESCLHGSTLGSNQGVSSCSSGYKGRGLTLQDILMHGDPWCSADKHKPRDEDILKTPPVSYQFSSYLPLGSVTVDEVALEQRRIVALYRSLFSAILSLVVGMIIWEAEDQCMPLVAALFIVVGMSLISVVQFFFTIRNKPASDAVALLSVNWFVLGALASPSLPSLAHALMLHTIRLADRMVSWFGFSAYYSGNKT